MTQQKGWRLVLHWHGVLQRRRVSISRRSLDVVITHPLWKCSRYSPCPSAALRKQKQKRPLPHAAANSSNQSMKPTSPPQFEFGALATTPCRGLSPSR